MERQRQSEREIGRVVVGGGGGGVVRMIIDGDLRSGGEDKEKGMGSGKRKGKEQGREGRQFDEMGGAMTVGVQGKEGESVAYGVANGRGPNKRVSPHPHTQTTTRTKTITTADRTPTHNPSSPYDSFFY